MAQAALREIGGDGVVRQEFEKEQIMLGAGLAVVAEAEIQAEPFARARL
jgi:hypothetical protein